MTTKSMPKKTSKKLNPVSPGELLWDEFMEPLGITRYRLAKEINVPAQRIGDIISGKRSVTADTDLRLCKFFGLSDGYWLRAQADFDVQTHKSSLEKVLREIIPWSESIA